MEKLDFRPVLLAWAAMQSKEMSPKKCARKGVGGLLRELRNHIGAGLPDLYGDSAKRAARLLESHCHFCGKCDRANIRPPQRQEENRRAD